MLRRIGAVIAGYALWTALWLSLGAALRAAGSLPADEATAVENPSALLMLLAGSIVASLAAGYVVAAVTRSSTTVPALILGLLLLATGVFVQLQYWHLMPVWYHAAFLALLLPVCVVGARSRQAHA